MALNIRRFQKGFGSEEMLEHRQAAQNVFMAGIAQVARLAFGLMAAVLGLAQQPSTHRPIIPVIGTVKAISGNVISVETGAGMENVVTDAHTEIWKGKTFHDLSPVQIGDDLSARCYRNASEKLVADVIWLNIVNFFGVITAVKGDSFEMLTNPNADPDSAYVKKTLKVSVDADTIFEASAKEDIRVGRGAQMVGLDLRNGTIRATRLTIYESKRPVRVKAGAKVMPLTGPAK